jgi:hypothetical protein
VDAVGFLPKRSHMDVCISRGFDAAALAFGGIMMGLDFLSCCTGDNRERGVVTRARGPTPPDVSEELGYRWGHRLEWFGRLSYTPGSETITASSYWYKGTFIGKSPRILPLRCRPLFSRRSPGFSF